jgi:hypothetical protein
MSREQLGQVQAELVQDFSREHVAGHLAVDFRF